MRGHLSPLRQLRHELMHVSSVNGSGLAPAAQMRIQLERRARCLSCPWVGALYELRLADGGCPACGELERLENWHR